MNNFLNKLRQNLVQGMYGRNGTDEMAQAFVGASILFIIIDFFASSGIFAALAFGCLGYALFRQMSRNVAKRRQENAAFLKATEKPRRSLQLAYKRIKNRKTTVYFTCEDCGTVFSLPKGKGKLRATCPKCHKQSIRNT